MEAGYDTLIELEPQDETRFLEKKKEIIAVKAHTPGYSWPSRDATTQ